MDVSDPLYSLATMPELSCFYGITITMHWREGHHLAPHFHARYGEHKASLDFAGDLVAGELPKRQMRLVQAWVELHAEELSADWQLMAAKLPPQRIPPLR